MDKLTRQQEDIICELLHHSHSEEVTQYILGRIGRENWTRRILSETLNLTKEQEDVFETLGGDYSIEDVENSLVEGMVISEIRHRLKQQGVNKYLYESKDYIDAISTGEIIVEGIDVEQIKKLVIDEV